MKRGSATLAAVLVVCACASDKQTDGPNRSPRGARQAAPVEEVAAQPKAAAPQPWDPFGAKPAAEPAAEIEKKAPDERDYAAELLAAIGSPVQCLRTRVGPDVPSAIAISLEATVVETGIVTRNQVTSAQLDASEIKCVATRLAALRLRAPIPDAPRTVRATLELNQQAPPAKPAAADQERAEESEGDAPDQEPAEPLEAAREDAPREEEPRYEEPRYEEPRYEEPRQDDPREEEPREEEPREEEPQPSEDRGSDDSAQPPE